MRIALKLISLVSFAVVVAAERFVRFISTDGLEYTGDAILPNGTTDASLSTSAKVIQGDILSNFTVTDEVKVPSFRCP